MTVHEHNVREFVRQFDTENTRRALALCEAGTLSWEQVDALFARALTDALLEVSA